MLFSIIIPTYNRASYVHKTITSLLTQSYAQFEIIVVDDGSTDNTEDVVASIADNRLRYFKKTNAERAAARNFGTQRAGGQYVNFFDSDDLAYSNHLFTAIEAIKKLGNPEVFQLGYDVKDDQGNLLREVKNWPSTINDRLIDGNHLSCNGVFIRRDIAIQFPFNETRLLSASEDYELWLRLASRFAFHCVSEITSTVVNHEFRSVLKINREKFIARIELLQQELLKDAVFLHRYGNKLNSFRSYLQIYIALHLALAKYTKDESLRYLIKAARLHPAVIFTKRFVAALKKVLI